MRIYQYTVLFGMLSMLVFAGCGEDRPPTVDTETETDTGDVYIPGTEDPSVPQTCADAEANFKEDLASTVGCKFYAVGMDKSDDNPDFGIVLSNVNFREEAEIEIWASIWDGAAYNELNEGVWQEIPLTRNTINPLKQLVIDDIRRIVLNNFGREYAGGENPKAYLPQAAIRIVSTVPITAYQFSPLAATGQSVFTSDASMLIPTTAWADEYQVIGYRTTSTLDTGTLHPNFAQRELALFAVVAKDDNTEVTITPSTEVREAYVGWNHDIPEHNELVLVGDDQPFTFTLHEADVLFVHAAELGASLSGTRVKASDGKLIGVFTGHQCANIPEDNSACDNIEEQIPGLQYWGKYFIGARFPNRNEVNHTDPVVWQVHASEDNTRVRFVAGEGVKGLPAGEIVLNRGEYHEMAVYGGVKQPGDFAMLADKAVAVLQYMTGSRLTRGADGQSTGWGDPALAYVPPADQFVGRYIVTVPSGWDRDVMVITRQAGEPVLLNGNLVDDALFVSLPKPERFDQAGDEPGLFEVARIPIADGNYIVESEDLSNRIGLIVVGLNLDNSYAYTGGMGLAVTNPLF